MAAIYQQVQEMQGLYGPFTIAERVVQKIWLRRDFDHRALFLQDGRSLVIRTPGAWNLLGGPDFRAARLLVDGFPVNGDIEVHFNVSDWRAHGHAADRAYDNVVLHVVLFPPSATEAPARSGDGREIPTLVLLPLLQRSLEEHASDEALESLTARDAAERIADLAALTKPDLLDLLRTRASARWKMKRHFAELRIAKVGWEDAAHQTALEILGYRRNRAPMLGLATGRPLATWVGAMDTEALYAEQAGRWQLQGVRPANHPRLRLRQYQTWVKGRPDWPEVLRMLLQTLPEVVPDQNNNTVRVRQSFGMTGLRERLSVEVLCDTVGGSRLDTLVCDGFLPLVAASTGRDLQPLWFHWFMGDMPFDLGKGLAMLGVAGRGAFAFCHGWGQGLLDWMTERDLRASG